MADWLGARAAIGGTLIRILHCSLYIYIYIYLLIIAIYKYIDYIYLYIYGYPGPHWDHWHRVIRVVVHPSRGKFNGLCTVTLLRSAAAQGPASEFKFAVWSGHVSSCRLTLGPRLGTCQCRKGQAAAQAP
jgi:hypothetical protein